MAFNGNLHEFGIVALLQLPNTNRLTGLLVITGDEHRAEFFYNSGKLVHAVCGSVEGNQALAVVIDWTEGDFVFQSGETCEFVSITEDLHHSLMWALKDRDERKKKEEELRLAEAERNRLEAEKAVEAGKAENRPVEGRAVKPFSLPVELLQSTTHTLYACIADKNGVIIAETQAESEYILSISQHLAAVCSFISMYPDGGVGKTFIDDKDFSLALSGIDSGNTVILFAAPNTRLGILSMELSKFIKELESSGFGERNEGRSH